MQAPGSLFRRLFDNTAVTALAFAVVGLIGLLLVPVIVSAYGLAVYGLLAVARSLVPAGLMALVDPGLSEQATRAVSQARVDGDWQRAGGRASALALAGAGAGLLAALVLAAVAPWIAMRMAGNGLAEGFTGVLMVSAVAAVPLFAALPLDGVVKAFEDFRRLRLIEVGTTIANAVAVVVIAQRGLAFEWIAYAFTASLLLRAALLLALAHRHLRRAGGTWQAPARNDLAEVWLYGRHLAASRIISTLRDQAPQAVIGLLIGAKAAGIYDVLVRLPRFVKVVLGVLNAGLLPTAARLDHAADDDALRRLLVGGTALVAAVSLPVTLAGAVFSAPLLRLWIGPELVEHAPWQALMFVVPALNSLTGFGATLLLTRPQVVRRLNLVAFWQTLLLYAVAVALAPALQERAFIAATGAMALLFFPFQMRVLLRELSIPLSDLRHTVWVALALGAFALVTWLAGVAALVQSVLALLVALALWGTIAGALGVPLLPAQMRRQLVQVARRPLGR